MDPSMVPYGGTIHGSWIHASNHHGSKQGSMAVSWSHMHRSIVDPSMYSWQYHGSTTYGSTMDQSPGSMAVRCKGPSWIHAWIHRDPLQYHAWTHHRYMMDHGSEHGGTMHEFIVNPLQDHAWIHCSIMHGSQHGFITDLWWILTWIHGGTRAIFLYMALGGTNWAWIHGGTTHGFIIDTWWIHGSRRTWGKLVFDMLLTDQVQ